ncbi:hypothetical protein RWE15_24880 [Virgibacillus halophilus]|uniref:D,D-heptose 1,7-bisphosphate phosphatase n=1 Tax=Tigheibacillus halophilus TaxID=361280 RepID=A0ABU5CC66_9BACI|nr:hypothetical protein [Virgibacillus halophilus]
MIEAVFVDRDGTIGGGKGVLYPDEFRLFSYVKQTIQRIKEAGITVCSFTNQPGISKRGSEKKNSIMKNYAGLALIKSISAPIRTKKDASAVNRVQVCYCKLLKKTIFL